MTTEGRNLGKLGVFVCANSEGEAVEALGEAFAGSKV